MTWTSSESGKIQAELLIIDGILYKKSTAGTWQQQGGVDNQALLQFSTKSTQASIYANENDYLYAAGERKLRIVDVLSIPR
jgi:hypothetical protein